MTRWHEALAHPWVRLGLVVIGIVCGAALLADVIAPLDAGAWDMTAQLAPPGAGHVLGTDENGRDVLTLIVHGARVALIVGLATVLVSTGVGVLVGGVAGYVGGRADAWLMRITDVVMSFPGVLLAILILFVTQRPSLLSVVIALSATGWAGYARLVRGQVLVEREREYVEAARALGIRPHTILVRHVLPNTVAPLLVQATFGMAGAILAEASLSFLGLGPQGTPSWGALLDQGAMYFLLTPHLALFPGLAIATTVLGINFLGDGLRDVLDPRSMR